MNRTTAARLLTLGSLALAGPGPAPLIASDWPLAADAPPRLSLHECRVLDDSVPARCGTFRVDEDRRPGTPRALELDLLVVPARDAALATDPVFILAGGPGQAATSLAPILERLASANLLRDVVFLDQRGTAGAHRLACPDPAPGDGEYGPENDAYWAACLRALQARADLRHYTTFDAVDDLDELRAALGYERVNLVGGSYGTRVAQVYLDRYPEQVRSAVLWAVAPAGYDIPVEGGLAVTAALDRLKADCRADAACASAFPRLGLRLDSLLTALEAEPHRVTRTPPAGGDPVEFEITSGLFGQTLLALLFDASHSRMLPLLVDRVAHGDWSRFAPIAAQVLEGRRTSPEGLYLSVLCNEDVPRIRPERLRELEGPYGELFRTSAEDLVHRCRRWPRADLPAEALAPARSMIPVLLLSGEIDPATPPEGAERALEYLPNARHIEVPATSHGPIFPGCVGELVSEFLREPVPGRLDAACVAEIGWPPFAVPRADPVGAP